MSLKQFCLLAVGFFVFACNRSTPTVISQYLNESKLPLLEFVIDPTRDTTVISQKGVKITIGKGTFSGTDKVTLEFKEALDFTAMLQAGLMTNSDGKVLSSAGMIYLNTKEYKIFNKAISVEIPASTALQDMELFKGEVQAGLTNWVDPTPLQMVTNDSINLVGKELFEENCTSCHRIEKDLTAPALANVSARWNKRWENLRTKFAEHLTNADTLNNHSPLYDFTRDWTNYVRAYELDAAYGCCVISSNPAAMNQFPNLSDNDLKAIYKHIEDETERLGLIDFEPGHSCDSCSALFQNYYELATWIEQQKKLANEKDTAIQNSQSNKSGVSNWIRPIDNQSDYYNIFITVPGWFNIDIFLEQRANVEESKLYISVSNYKAGKLETFLAIPSFKVLTPGGILNDGKQIGFKNIDGSLPLPQNTKAFVFAVAEENGVFYFARKDFTTVIDQRIELTVEQLDKTHFEKRLADLGLPSTNNAIEISDNTDSLEAIDGRLNAIIEKVNAGKCPCLGLK